MIVTQHYDSPLGGILLAADEIGLRDLWFDGQKYFAQGLTRERVEGDAPALSEAKRWLDIYFTGKEPDFRRRCTRSAPRSGSRYGRFFCGFPTERP